MRTGEQRRLRRAELAIHTAWDALARPNGIVRDGAMPRYCEQPTKLLIVLKEANDPEGKWIASGRADLRLAPIWNFDERGYRRTTWDVMLKWAALAMDGRRVDHITPSIWRTLSSRIAVMNLKKEPGGATTKASDIWRVVNDQRRRKLLLKQLSLYRPDVTICGSDLVAEGLGKLLGWSNEEYKIVRCSTGDDVWCLKSRTLGWVISFWHPAQRTRKHRDLLRILYEVLAMMERFGHQLPTRR